MMRALLSAIFLVLVGVYAHAETPEPSGKHTPPAELVVMHADVSGITADKALADPEVAELLAKALTHEPIAASGNWKVVKVDVAALRAEELAQGLKDYPDPDFRSSLRNLPEDLRRPVRVTLFPGETLVIEPTHLHTNQYGTRYGWYGKILEPTPGKANFNITPDGVLEGLFYLGDRKYGLYAARLLGVRDNSYHVVLEKSAARGEHVSQ